MSVISTNSGIFVGDSLSVKSQIEGFLQSVRAQRPNEKEFQLVHALVFPKDFSVAEIHSLNLEISSIYRKMGCLVLGGDTSSGAELSVFISVICM